MLKKLMQALGLEKPEIEIGAPCAGAAVAVSQVSDPTFSGEILGKGAAVQPAKGRVVSPVNGVIDTMFETGHAVSIIANEGPEVLVHIGLDTIELKGRHYTIHKQSGEQVKKGDLLIEFDLNAIKAEGYDVITPVVICNSDEYEFEARTGPVQELEPLIILKKKN